jgi:hypothetical protein
MKSAKDDYAAISLTIADPEQQSVSDVLENISKFDEDMENIDGIDGIECQIPRISGEDAIRLLEHLLSEGYDSTVHEMVIEVRG